MGHAILILASLVVGALGQSVTSIGGYTFTDDVDLCYQTLEDANITGITAWNPNIAQDQQAGQPKDTSGTTLDVGWAVTVNENSGVSNASAQWGLWYSTYGANYSYDLGLGYDVCLFVMGSISDDVYLRAQDDNGTCLAALDPDCVDDIQSMTTGFALGATLSDGEIRSNLTAGSTNAVCEQIATEMRANFPPSCQKFMNDSYPVTFAGGALTSNNHSGLYDTDRCSITNATTNNVFHHIYTLNKYTLNNAGIAHNYYDLFSYLTIPVMTTFMPIADAGAQASIYHAKSFLRCPRATTVNPSSETPSPAPKPTPLPSGKGLTAGAKAGIAVGVVAAVFLVAAAAFFFWRRRRQAPKKLKTIEPGTEEAPSPAFSWEERKALTVRTPLAEAPPGEVSCKELSPDTEVSPYRVELTGNSRRPIAEKEGSPVGPPPAELLADVPKRED